MNLASLFVDPVTLDPLEDLASHDRGTHFEFLPKGSLSYSNKNEKELAHFKKTYRGAKAESDDYRQRINWIDHPELDGSEVVVDIGCGPYDNISSLGVRLRLAIDDLASFYTEELMFTPERSTLISARSELIPLKSESVDIIYCINMLDHVDDVMETVGELFRVLKPDGKLVLQCYFNSYPLQETEPGVIDGYFVSEPLSKLFDISQVRALALGDHSINTSYNCDVIGGVLRKNRPLAEYPFPRKPRERFADPGYLGPQSTISNALSGLDKNDLVKAAALISTLEIGGLHDIHYLLLQAKLKIAQEDFGAARLLLEGALAHPRAKQNVRTQLTICRLERQRILKAERKINSDLKLLNEKLAKQFKVSGAT